jgi:hypothetical protein
MLAGKVLQRCRKSLVGAALLLAASGVAAQTVLTGIDVRAPKWEERHGGYLISGNFDVDPKTPSAHSASPRKRKIASGFRTKASSSCGCSAFR